MIPIIVSIGAFNHSQAGTWVFYMRRRFSTDANLVVTAARPWKKFSFEVWLLLVSTIFSEPPSFLHSGKVPLALERGR
jgi:hypothetical protein